MIGRIRGRLIEKTPPTILVELASGIAYDIFAPMTTLYQLGQPGEEIIVYTHGVYREDDQQLYGFISKKDRLLFQNLIKVNGIGAKMALAVLSTLDVDALCHCIEQKNYEALCAVPGVGKKTAERLVLDMKDRLNALSLLPGQQASHQDSVSNDMPTPSATTSGTAQPYNKRTEAVEALVALGYKPKEAERHVAKVVDQSDQVETIIKLALQNTVKR